MRFKLLSMFAAMLLLAACESASDQGNAAAGGGTATGNQQTTRVVPGSSEDFVQNVGDRVFFDYDRSDLKPEARQTLERQAAWLKQYSNVRLQIEGHCDERGTREYNLALGERRANAAKNYLVALGIPASRLSTISYGKERPAVLGSNETSWAQNRRAVSVVQ
jgi:peptidoglycan-associated lipoprotein